MAKSRKTPGRSARGSTGKTGPGGRPAKRPESSGTPEGRPLLSLVMIVKNEEVDLPSCLDSVIDVIDEMVIVDTGSTDRTKEVAAAYEERMKRAIEARNTNTLVDEPAVRIVDFEWCDDFAAARNFGIEAASGEWIMQLDADEVLLKGRHLLRSLLDNPAADALSITITKLDPANAAAESLGDFSAVRIFRNRPDIRYLRPVHEHVVIADPRRKLRSPIVINHLGSFKQKDRFERNMTMLKKAVDADPDDYYLWSRIGDEHFGREEYSAAVQAYRECVRSPRDDLLFVADAKRSLAFSLYKVGEAAEALVILRELEESHPRYTDAFFVEGCIRLWEGDSELGQQILRRCLEMGDPPQGYGTWGGTGSWRPEKALNWLSGGA